MARDRTAAGLSLEDRLASDRQLTGGTMPLDVVVDDEAERARALALNAGRKHGKLLRIITQAESDARRHRRAQ